ncbi:hypothetical protein IPA_04440 [Ignicoccus pacificus DSM 13166]|uniref:VIT family protein n=1 Tax=Ignicoccus pacificus DSM 13166 TaxID=940294 RepID=A0A977KB58_9CREN|nr:hypothetical protein IPA_04440 [Ignicoccus pacificus DSM 13166]
MLKNLKIDEIARRVFATNGVDALLSAIGVLSGTSSISHSENPNVYLGAVLGGALSLGLLSGFLGVMITERSERLKELKELEKSMMKKLDNTMYARVVNYASIYVALWSLLGSLGLPLIAITPLFLALRGLLVTHQAVLWSLVMAHIELFLLGLYIGKDTSPIRIALQYLSLGIAAHIIASMLGAIIS